MSEILDQIKFNIGSNLSKYYKTFKSQMTPEDWREFEAWFWKIRPLLAFDITKYSSNIRVYDKPESNDSEKPKISEESNMANRTRDIPIENI